MSRFAFSQSELDRVPHAIAEAEAGTNAEIFAVLAQRSDDYRFVAYSFCALWVFLLSGLLALWFFVQTNVSSTWGVEGRSIIGFEHLSIFIFAQIGAFVAIVLVMRLFPNLAIRIAPQRIRQERARANGIRQFLAHGVDKTSARSGVLVFVSLDERYAEIFCDHGIEQKFGRDFFLEQVEILVEHCSKGEVISGYEVVIGAIGDELGSIFPKSSDDTNELEDRFVVLPG